MLSRLQNGDVFPRLAIDVVGGRTITLPGDLAGSYAVILFYRGSWCPYCCAQLAAFSRASERLAAAGVVVVALSVDDEATSKALIEKLRLTFPLDSAPTRTTSRQPRAPMWPRVPPMCNRPASCSTRVAGSSRRCIQAGRSVASFLTMSLDS